MVWACVLRLQVQQISWHQNDFMMGFLGLGIAWVAALAALMSAAWGQSRYAQAPFIMAICALYVALGGYSLARCAVLHILSAYLSVVGQTSLGSM